MESNTKLNIDKNYLDELISYVSRSLVGKALKRFEILENKEMIKSDVKELIYEELRHLRDLIEAHSKGLNSVQFKFKTNKENPSA